MAGQVEHLTLSFVLATSTVWMRRCREAEVERDPRATSSASARASAREGIAPFCAILSDAVMRGSEDVVSHPLAMRP